ncbi:MAG TPA: FtsX-like permease family protein, partial [Candidatus Binataceae bacterium]
VMRALGFAPLTVANILFGECALIGLIGGGIGAGLAWWMFADGVTLGAVLGGASGSLWITPLGALGAATVAIITSLLSGIIPIIGAMRIAPAIAFREVV